jgi:hypothetical protein
MGVTRNAETRTDMEGQLDALIRSGKKGHAIDLWRGED